MSKTKDVLGRGLEALLKNTPLELTHQYSINNVQNIPINKIIPNPNQPRKHFDNKDLEYLSQSIKIHGIIQPIIVKQQGNNYQVIAGERRLHAAKLANLKEVPAYIRMIDDKQVLELALIENIQRVDLNPIEIATSYKQLIKECNITQEELSNRVGKDRTTVNNYLRLLKLPPEIQVALLKTQISMGHARALINLNNTHEQIELLNKIIKEQLSVRQVENLVAVQKKKNITIANKNIANEKINNLSSMLCSYLDAKVNIKLHKEEIGEIKISFVSLKDLNRIIDLLYSS